MTERSKVAHAQVRSRDQIRAGGRFVVERTLVSMLNDLDKYADVDWTTLSITIEPDSYLAGTLAYRMQALTKPS